MMYEPILIKGDRFKDDRGVITYINEFDLSLIKRMYTIIHPDKKVVRAWQGHQHESKWFKCIKGSFVVAWQKIDDFDNLSHLPLPEYKILESKNSEVLFIPPSYANGLKALEDNSELIVFSNYCLEDSLKDKIRFDQNLWLDWEQF